MMKIIYIFTAVFLVLSGYLTAQEVISENQIIVKFKPNTTLLRNWVTNNRKGEFKEFRYIIGNNYSKPFISDELLKTSDNPKNSADLMSVGSSVSGLSRISIITYSSTVDASYAAKKISKNPMVEYAEPVPVHHFFNIPNDPRISYQYYLNKVNAFSAWDSIPVKDTIVVGIVDTGVDYTHEDLADNIWQNPGETGLDSLGRDKRTNGVDDDHDGYIDDWHGWDFARSDSSGQDNDPMPGHKHGTHLAGTVAAVINNGIGIAGIAKNVKILPVKVGGDNSFSTSVQNGFQGVLYAAKMGAKVINCSWGSTTRSQAEQEIINTVVQSGSVVCAASGNNGRYQTFYPAGYMGVMSVAAVDSNDRRAWFSNYDPTVDVSAPGEEIYATVPGNFYEFMDGTSMASPVAAGVTALVRLRFPGLNPLQVIEMVKAGTDNIDSLNPSYKNLLGKGRVNALKTIGLKNPKSVILTDYKIKDSDNDGAYNIGDTVRITPKFLNVLSPVSKLTVDAAAISSYQVSFVNKIIIMGSMNTLEERQPDTSFSFVVTQNIPLNYSLQLELRISEDTVVLNREYINLTLNPSYRTMNRNNISVTFNNIGNIAYNDYPNNYQGDGFTYKNSSSILFEGALMVGCSADRISNVARNSSGGQQDRSFQSNSFFKLTNPGIIAALEGNAIFVDSRQPNEVGVKVNHRAYQFTTEPDKDLIITSYSVLNQSGGGIDSLYVALFFDWDIGPSGSDDIVNFDFPNGFGYAKNNKDATLPWVGVKLLSQNQGLNFFAIDNDGSTDDNPGIYSGYSRAKKWRTMTSGIGRSQSNITDASMVVSAGPIQLADGDSTTVVFSMFAGYDYNSLANSSTESDMLFYSNFPQPVKKQNYDYVSPNPIYDGKNIIHFPLPQHKNETITIVIFNELGQKCTITKETYVLDKQNDESIDVSQLGSGFYFVYIKTSISDARYPFVVLR